METRSGHMSNKNDILHAGASESEYERPTFAKGYDKPATPIAPKNAVRSDLAAGKMCITPGISQQASQKIFSQQMIYVTEPIRIHP